MYMRSGWSDVEPKLSGSCSDDDSTVIMSQRNNVLWSAHSDPKFHDSCFPFMSERADHQSPLMIRIPREMRFEMSIPRFRKIRSRRYRQVVFSVLRSTRLGIHDRRCLTEEGRSTSSSKVLAHATYWNDHLLVSGLTDVHFPMSSLLRYGKVAMAFHFACLPRCVASRKNHDFQHRPR
jgi:hypothetical protein